jgi:hypothetical protein
LKIRSRGGNIRFSTLPVSLFRSLNGLNMIIAQEEKFGA